MIHKICLFVHWLFLAHQFLLVGKTFSIMVPLCALFQACMGTWVEPLMFCKLAGLSFLTIVRIQNPCQALNTQLWGAADLKKGASVFVCYCYVKIANEGIKIQKNVKGIKYASFNMLAYHYICILVLLHFLHNISPLSSWKSHQTFHL
jgi:hypothetical protein